MDRYWLPTFGELIDRLSIHQLKEVLIPEYKSKYASEMDMIAHDIDLLIQNNDIKASSKLVRLIVALSQINSHIWYNEAAARRGEDQDLCKLKLTHGLNGIRNSLMNKISCLIDDSHQDYKTDCLAADFEDWQMGILKDDICTP
jgi:hypothetical protein